jgi:hypothetical protein
VITSIDAENIGLNPTPTHDLKKILSKLEIK